MKLERSEYLGAGPYERIADRRGYANGFKPKRMKRRLGELDLAIPKMRGLDEGVEPFYPHALERGERSERALKLALAEMYVQGVSTRKVAAITQKLCGFEVSSTRVATLFPNEASLLRLATAILSEVSEEWETGRIYLSMEAE